MYSRFGYEKDPQQMPDGTWEIHLTFSDTNDFDGSPVRKVRTANTREEAHQVWREFRVERYLGWVAEHEKYWIAEGDRLIAHRKRWLLWGTPTIVILLTLFMVRVISVN